jgi:hypothetical protein
MRHLVICSALFTAIFFKFSGWYNSLHKMKWFFYALFIFDFFITKMIGALYQHQFIPYAPAGISPLTGRMNFSTGKHSPEIFCSTDAA